MQAIPHINLSKFFITKTQYSHSNDYLNSTKNENISPVTEICYMSNNDSFKIKLCTYTSKNQTTFKLNKITVRFYMHFFPSLSSVAYR